MLAKTLALLALAGLVAALLPAEGPSGAHWAALGFALAAVVVPKG